MSPEAVELFCREYARHGNAAEAYVTAHPRAKNWKPESIYPKASTLLASDKVQTRLSELQQAVAKETQTTVESLVRELEEVRNSVMTEGGSKGAAVNAIMGKAKLLGFLVDKTELTGKDGAEIKPVLNVIVARDKP